MHLRTMQYLSNEKVLVTFIIHLYCICLRDNSVQIRLCLGSVELDNTLYPDEKAAIRILSLAETDFKMLTSLTFRAD